MSLISVGKSNKGNPLKIALENRTFFLRQCVALFNELTNADFASRFSVIRIPPFQPLAVALKNSFVYGHNMETKCKNNYLKFKLYFSLLSTNSSQGVHISL